VTTRAAIGLGSNLGDRAAHLDAARRGLADLGTVVAVSPIYETAPVGGPDQGPYLNAVVVLDTDLPARRLLEACLAIEGAAGRERRERWGPRTLDLDLLLYGSETIDEPGLVVPHPRMRERRFVLAPLLDVWPDAALPDGTQLAGLLAAVADQEVRRRDGPESRRMAVAMFLVAGILAVLLWLAWDWVF
jgi:2-amino-4-hydroxy-6-hydroxymethyldihydropteridine diphosphokinase